MESVTPQAATACVPSFATNQVSTMLQIVVIIMPMTAGTAMLSVSRPTGSPVIRSYCAVLMGRFSFLI